MRRAFLLFLLVHSDGSRKILFVLCFFSPFSLIAWIFHSSLNLTSLFSRSLIFCLSFFSHPATCYLARACGTHINLPIHTMAPPQEIISFIKGNLFFNRYFLYFSLISVFTGFLYESHYVCVGFESYSKQTFLKINLSNETN